MWQAENIYYFINSFKWQQEKYICTDILLLSSSCYFPKIKKILNENSQSIQAMFITLGRKQN